MAFRNNTTQWTVTTLLVEESAAAAMPAKKELFFELKPLSKKNSFHHDVEKNDLRLGLEKKYHLRFEKPLLIILYNVYKLQVTKYKMLKQQKSQKSKL